MKKMKAIIALVLVISIVMISTIIQINAAETPMFSFNSLSGNTGEEVVLTLNCSNNPGITGWAVNIGYDSDALQLIKADGKSVFGDVTVSQDINENPFRAQWFSLNDSTSNGTMLVLTFKINENAQSGDYIVSISYAEDEVVNVNDENVYFDTMNGIVTVKSSEPETTEPVTTEPVTTEPATTEPETTEPVTTEPVTTEPATAEPVTTEPVTTEPVTTEPVTTEPVTTEPVTTEPVTTEPATTKPVTIEPVTTAPVTTEPIATETVTIPEMIDQETTTTEVNEDSKSSTADQVVNTNQTGTIQTGNSDISFVLLIVMMSALVSVYVFSKKRNNNIK
ncbi:MAG: LPXTG cell wall anchor domain-containing protein [Acutalibacteraceae bacterium]|nr:LPXTG cell wall anchor domain-containing protein [Acutalibacteraceae bacterium]